MRPCSDRRSVLFLQVLMKIIKYSSDALLSGPLMGLLVPSSNTLEVTDCFPTYTDDLADHQTQMLRSLREVHTMISLFRHCNAFQRRCFPANSAAR